MEECTQWLSNLHSFYERSSKREKSVVTSFLHRSLNRNLPLKITEDPPHKEPNIEKELRGITNGALFKD
jgi:hypothetical protein